MADGLPKFAWSKFIIPSLRFRGLDFAAEAPVLRMLFSSRINARYGAWFSFDVVPNGFEMNGATASPSELVRGSIRFSTSSSTSPDDCGVALPLSLRSLSVDLPGLRCELFDRDVTPIGLSLRILDRVFRTPGGYGVAKGDEGVVFEIGR